MNEPKKPIRLDKTHQRNGADESLDPEDVTTGSMLAIPDPEHTDILGVLTSERKPIPLPPERRTARTRSVPAAAIPRVGRTRRSIADGPLGKGLPMFIDGVDITTKVIEGIPPETRYEKRRRTQERLARYEMTPGGFQHAVKKIRHFGDLELAENARDVESKQLTKKLGTTTGRVEKRKIGSAVLEEALTQIGRDSVTKERHVVDMSGVRMEELGKAEDDLGSIAYLLVEEVRGRISRTKRLENNQMLATELLAEQEKVPRDDKLSEGDIYTLIALAEHGGLNLTRPSHLELHYQDLIAKLWRQLNPIAVIGKPYAERGKIVGGQDPIGAVTGIFSQGVVLVETDDPADALNEVKLKMYELREASAKKEQIEEKERELFKAVKQYIDATKITDDNTYEEYIPEGVRNVIDQVLRIVDGYSLMSPATARAIYFELLETYGTNQGTSQQRGIALIEAIAATYDQEGGGSRTQWPNFIKTCQSIIRRLTKSGQNYGIIPILNFLVAHQANLPEDIATLVQEINEGEAITDPEAKRLIRGYAELSQARLERKEKQPERVLEGYVANVMHTLLAAEEADALIESCLAHVDNQRIEVRIAVQIFLRQIDILKGQDVDIMQAMQRYFNENFAATFHSTSREITNPLIQAEYERMQNDDDEVVGDQMEIISGAIKTKAMCEIPNVSATKDTKMIKHALSKLAHRRLLRTDSDMASIEIEAIRQLNEYFEPIQRRIDVETLKERRKTIIKDSQIPERMKAVLLEGIDYQIQAIENEPKSERLIALEARRKEVKAWPKGEARTEELERIKPELKKERAAFRKQEETDVEETIDMLTDASTTILKIANCTQLESLETKAVQGVATYLDKKKDEQGEYKNMRGLVRYNRGKTLRRIERFVGIQGEVEYDFVSTAGFGLEYLSMRIGQILTAAEPTTPEATQAFIATTVRRAKEFAGEFLESADMEHLTEKYAQSQQIAEKNEKVIAELSGDIMTILESEKEDSEKIKEIQKIVLAIYRENIGGKYQKPVADEDVYEGITQITTSTIIDLNSRRKMRRSLFAKMAEEADLKTDYWFQTAA